MEPAASVVLTVYNATWCVERALDSVLAQTLPADQVEVLVCDDGSTDGTPDLVERRYGARVRVLRLPHRNAAATRRVGLAEARGTWLSFLDADDWWETGKLARQLEFAERHADVAWISCDGQFVSAEGVIRESWLSDYFTPVTERVGDLFPLLVRRCFPLMSSSLVRRDAYHAVGGIDPGIVYSHDYDLWLRVAARYPAALLADRLVHYWSSEGSLSRRLEARHLDDLAIMERVAAGELRDDPTMRRMGHERAAAIAFDLALLCLRDGRSAEMRRLFRRARVAGPSSRRAFATAGSLLPGGLARAARGWSWLKGPVASTREVKRAVGREDGAR